MRIFPQVAYGLADAGGGGEGGGQQGGQQGAGGDGQQQQQQGGGQQQQGGGQQQQQQPWSPPKDLAIPPEFLGTSAEETLGKLFKGYGELNTRFTGMRDDLARRGTAPAKPEDYTFNPGEKIKGYFGEDPAKHSGLAAARGVFHKHGVPQGAFEGIINELYGGMAERGELPAPYSAKKEIEAYAREHGVDATAGLNQIKENEAFANGLIGQLEGIPEKLKADASAELKALTDTAGGQALLRAMMGRMAKAGIIVVSGDGVNNNGPLTDSELDRLTSDPRIDPRNKNNPDADKKFDPVLRQRYDDGMAARGRAKYGGKTGGG